MQFHKSERKYRAIGGGIGSGKTLPGIVEAIKQSFWYENNYGFILRKSYSELRISTMKDFFDICPSWMIIKHNLTHNWVELLNSKGTYLKTEGATDKEIQDAGGISEIEFISFENRADAYKKFRSANLGWFMIDQAEEASEEIFDELNNRLRREPAEQRSWLIFNPEGRNWIWKLFHPESSDHKPELFDLVSVITSDNPFLPSNYIPSLHARYGGDKVARYMQGSYDSFSGVIYNEFSLNTHVIDPIPLGIDWLYAIGLDHGLNNPTAVVFAAKDDEGNIFIIDEYYESGKIVSEHVQYLKPKLHPKCVIRVIDPSCRNRDPITGRSVIQEYAIYGLYFWEGNHDVAAGINRCAEYIHINPNRIHPVTKEKGSPRLFVFRNCVNFIKEILNYQWEKGRLDKENEPEKPLKKDDHLMDAMRYLLMEIGEDFKFKHDEQSDKRDAIDLTKATPESKIISESIRGRSHNWLEV